MSTTLVDSPPAPGTQGTQPAEDAGSPPAQQGAPPPAPGRACPQCGSELAPGQDWCLQCGAAAPAGRGGWRPAALVAAAGVILALGAAAAAYAAFDQHSQRPPTVTRMVAQAPAPATTVPVTPPPATTPAPTPKVPLTSVKPPKIPLTVPTPKSSTPAGTGGGSQTTPSTPESQTGGSQTGGSEGGESQPASILLDTNAASTYNPYAYPAEGFGDPSLAIDGDPATGWSARVDAATAPNMAEGLLIDLKSRDKLSSLKLATSTTGMTVQVYGAKGKTAPASITDPAWVALSHQQVIHKRHVRIKLRHQGRAYTFVTLWISKAPPSSTAAAPGHVSVNEVELFPAG